MASRLALAVQAVRARWRMGWRILLNAPAVQSVRARWRIGWRILLDEDVARDRSTLTSAALEDRKKRLETKVEVTKRISETTRTLAFGSLASCYALLLTDADLASLFAGARPLLLWSAGFGIFAIIVDAAQYLFGFVNVQQALMRRDQQFPKNWSRRGRAVCFVVKQILALLAAMLLLIAVGLVLFGPAPLPAPAPAPAPTSQPASTQIWGQFLLF